MEGAPRAEDGQALVLGVLILALMVVVALAVAGLAVALAGRARAQAAADAAALACATQGTWTQWVDARGRVYAVAVAVRQGAGARAAAQEWRANLTRTDLRTGAFQVQAAGPTCRVAVQVSLRLGALGVLGPGREVLRWGVAAEARAYSPGAGAGSASGRAGEAP